MKFVILVNPRPIYIMVSLAEKEEDFNYEVGVRI